MVVFIGTCQSDVVSQQLLRGEGKSEVTQKGTLLEYDLHMEVVTEIATIACRRAGKSTLLFLTGS